MQQRILAVFTVVALSSAAIAVQAKPFLLSNPPDSQLIAFPININITPPSGGNSSGGSSGSTTQPNQDASSPQAFKGFSGKYTPYTDTYNGFKLSVPAEFQLGDRGATTTWNGPLMDGGSASIYINAAPLKGVPSKVVYEANLKSKKEDRNYTDVVPVKVKYGNKTVYAFRCKEAAHKPGSPEPKAAGDIHRWHLFVFGNEMVYTLGFTGPFASFQGNKLQAVYEDGIKSVELIPVSG